MKHIYRFRLNGRRLAILLSLIVFSLNSGTALAGQNASVESSLENAVCNWAEFIKDVTIPDGTVLSRGEEFTKVWRLKNIGSCTWTPDYSVVFDSGQVMTNKKSYPLNTSVKPGETIDIAVKMTAPTRQGRYQSKWMLKDSRGERFGIGPKANVAFWVEIRVGKPGSPGSKYDLASNYCQAEWRSGFGPLSCPGSRESKTGSVILSNSVTLENRIRSDKVLITIPNYARNGWIKGTFPSLTIQNGYHFISEIGCLDGSRRCDVTFRLGYRTTGNSRMVTLASWRETNDGKTTPINVDLSQLAGKRVQLILQVEVNNRKPDRAYAFWVRPRVEQMVISSFHFTQD